MSLPVLTTRAHIPSLVIALAAFMWIFSLLPASAQTTFDVKTYGAKGNGTANDDKALQAAFKAANAAPGSVVFFPAGTYLYTTKLIAKDITVKAATQNTTLKPNKSSAVLEISGKTAVQKLTINGTASVGISVIGGKEFLLDNVNFRGIGQGISIASSNQGTILGCDFFRTSAQRCILCKDSPSITMQGCVMEGEQHTNDKAIWGAIFNSCPNLKIERNEFRFIDQCAVVDHSNDLLFDNNKMVSSAIGLAAMFSTNVAFKDNRYDGNFREGPPAPTSFSDAYQTDHCTNVLLQFNESLDTGHFSYKSDHDKGVQIQQNEFEGAYEGLHLIGSQDVTATRNRIERMLLTGIFVQDCSDKVGIIDNRLLAITFTQNNIRSVVYVDCPSATSIKIQNNEHAGTFNTYLDYYIKCLQPAPLATVSGNITTSGLPSKVGP